MFNCLKKQKFDELAKQGRRIPVYRQIPADRFTPISIYQALADDHSPSFILDSTEHEGEMGRYSFMGFDPVVQLSSDKVEDPIGKFRALLDKYRTVTLENVPPFSGGAVGFLTYDAVRFFEKIPNRHPNLTQVPDLLFNFYDTTIAYDHDRSIISIFHVVDPNGNFDRAQEILDNIERRMEESRPPRSIPSKMRREIKPEIDDESFIEMIEKAKVHIREGDIFQVVLSRRFTKETNAAPFDIFRSLRLLNPSAYLFYLQEANYVITGASPEKLVSLRGKTLTTNPLAGTAPRKFGTEGDRVEKELLSDSKECAEHMMLVDLARNDLGSIAKPKSVAVKDLKSIMRLSQVIHISSEVQAEIDVGKDAIDALRATLPAGTLSGAPKIRAMELIDTLEPSKRGIYGGAICYIDNQGNLDSCIAIRTVFIQNGKVVVQAGAGIVIDSDPEKEVQETLHKAKGVIKAIQLAEEGLPC